MACWVDSPAPYGATGQVEGDLKPTRRLKATRSEWEVLRGRFAGACCAHCGLAAESLHHIVSKARGGNDEEANLAPLCGDGARGCHGLIESHGNGWERVAASIRNYVCNRSDRWAYVLGKLGEDLFDRTYPAVTRICVDRLCVLPDGHSGAHLSLSAKEFQPRDEQYFSPREQEDKL